MLSNTLSSIPPGICIERQAGDALELRLTSPVGFGTMKTRFVTPHLAVATVDFACEVCPIVPFTDKTFSGFWERGVIFTVNLCLEGRCEVSLAGNGYAIVKPGDFCVSCTDAAPEEYRYPLGRYRGIEVLAHSGCVNDPEFRILQADGLDLVASVRKAGVAAIYAGDAEFNKLMKRIGDAQSSARLAYESLGLLLALCELDLSEARPPTLLTRSQMAIARTVRERLDADLSARHDVRDFAREFEVSATTLNNYFSAAYGQTVAAYLRRRRIERAAIMLAGGSDIASAALSVGYENPSKFTAAFKRLYETTPSEYRRKAQLESQYPSAGGSMHWRG